VLLSEPGYIPLAAGNQGQIVSILSQNRTSDPALVEPSRAAPSGDVQDRPKPRILVVDDIVDNRNILARRFQKRNFEVVEADCGTAALELIAARSFDTVLLDINMPDMSGLEVLRRIRDAHTPESLPVIMVTANNQNTDIVQALEMGANDYVSKPVEFTVALARVNAQVKRKQASEALASANQALHESNDQLEERVSERTARLIEANQQLMNEMAARRNSEARTQYLAYHDALTGLANRLLFREELQRALDGARRTANPLAIFFIDLDGFKNVNDTYGHSVGDALLKELGDRLLDRLGEGVRVARLGGDEFGILQTSAVQPAGAITLAGVIDELVSTPVRVENHNLNVGASIGIVVSECGEEDAEFLLKAADLAMYRAKSDGGGTYRLFDPEMDVAAQSALRLKMDIREALANGHFSLYYQPIVSMDSKRVTTCEALLRWSHPERGWILPSEFIPLAEDTGLIVQIGEWVLRRACEEALGWPTSVNVAVNLSPVQFQRGKLVESVFSALASSGLKPSRLELEITESVLLGNTERNVTTLRQLRELGVRVSMDDFGTGFSSLSYLRNFPFDKIKIDQSFIRNLLEDSRSETIVGAIAGLGVSFGMTTTAEGVETEEQLKRLVGKGCSEIQGFFYSRPVPAGEVLAMIHRINGLE
jgi:diguanylate cyclase (GGDEF)-like protein